MATRDYASSEMTALRLAVLIKKSGKPRARISDKTIRILSGRRTLRESFTVAVRTKLEDLGIVSIRLDRGGYAMVMATALEGAPPALVKNLMPGFRKWDRDDLLSELGLPEDEPDE